MCLRSATRIAALGTLLVNASASTRRSRALFYARGDDRHRDDQAQNPDPDRSAKARDERIVTQRGHQQEQQRHAE